MSGLIELEQYKELDMKFDKTFQQICVVFTVLIICMFVFFSLLQITEVTLGQEPLYKRFLGLIPVGLLTLCTFLNVIVNAWATYLRCHKKEPFLVNSITSGLLCLASTMILGKKFGLYGIIIGYTLVCIFMLPWGYWIFKTKKKEWHE